jgi:hypothetical protein
MLLPAEYGAGPRGARSLPRSRHGTPDILSRRHALKTLRCPIRIDGAISKSTLGAPTIGQHTADIDAELGI